MTRNAVPDRSKHEIYAQVQNWRTTQISSNPGLAVRFPLRTNLSGSETNAPGPMFTQQSEVRGDRTAGNDIKIIIHTEPIARHNRIISILFPGNCCQEPPSYAKEHELHRTLEFVKIANGEKKVGVHRRGYESMQIRPWVADNSGGYGGVFKDNSGGYGEVLLNLFYISYPLLSNKITRFTPNTLSGAHFLKIWN